MSDTVRTGRRLGRYRLAQVIGHGGMGVVHLALDERGRAVAVKVLRAHVAADPDARQRLAREVDTLIRVRSPRVAEVLDADVDCDTPYVVTRYVPAPPLDHFVAERGPLAGERLARLGLGLGEALAAIHAVDVVHRDLKPGNVLMLEGDPVVIDFGIAHVADDIRLTSTGLVMGTPGYLSPELVEGAPVHQAADWWGWAATMTFAATGRPPFGRGPLEVVLDRVRRGAPDLDGAPPVLVPLLAAALSPDPAERPRPGALRRAAERLRADSLARPVPPPAPPRDATIAVPAAADPRGARTTPVPPPAAPAEGATAVVPFVPPTRAVPRPDPTQVVPPAAAPATAPATVPLRPPFPPAATAMTRPAGRGAPPAPWPGPGHPGHPGDPGHGGPAGPPRHQAPGPAVLHPHTRPLPAAPLHHPFPPAPVQARPQHEPVPVGGPMASGGEQAPAPAPRSKRTGTVLAGLLLLVCVAAAAPQSAAVLAVVWLLVARTVDAASGSLLRRRYERGARRGDRLLAVASSPWHLLVQLLVLVPVLLLPVLVGAGAAYVPGAVAPVQDLAGGTSLGLASAALGLALTAWWGPGGARTRRGTRRLVRAIAPGRTGATVAVLVCVVLAGTAVAVLGASGWVPQLPPETVRPSFVP